MQMALESYERNLKQATKSQKVELQNLEEAIELERNQVEAKKVAREVVKEALDSRLREQITEVRARKEGENYEHKNKIATAFEELADRFTRKRYMDRSHAKEYATFQSTAAKERSLRVQSEKERYLEECKARKEFLDTRQSQMIERQASKKLAETQLMRSVWFNQATKRNETKEANMLASLM